MANGNKNQNGTMANGKKWHSLLRYQWHNITGEGGTTTSGLSTEDKWEQIRSCVQYGKYFEMSPLDFTQLISNL